MVVRQLIAWNVRLSRSMDRFLPAVYRRDGYEHYLTATVPRHLRPNACIYDVGGGKRPYLTAEAKQALGARVVGIDIDAGELAQAPAGTYDRAVTADIAAYAGEGDADLVICQTVLEHVRDTDRSVAALASILKPGGEALVFVPCRNALFARLNLLLPERVKQTVLFAIYPESRQSQGFPSHYQDCTPSALSRLARRHGLEEVERTTYWSSAYFHAFVPAYVLWRLWLIVAKSLGREDCCETFSFVLRKPKADDASPS